MRHTPGPWVVRDVSCPEEMYEVQREDGGEVIAFAADCEDRKANAYLIAAAPDMLAALEQMREVFEQLSDGDWRSMDATYVDQLVESYGLRGCDVAIAKAKGGE